MISKTEWKVRTAVRMLATLGTVWMVAGVASATDINWSDAGTAWGTGANWVGGSEPGAANTANFPSDAAIANQPTVGTGTNTVGGIKIDNTQADYSLGGTGLLTNGAGGLTITGGGTTAISAKMFLSATQTWDIGSSTVNMNGAFLYPGNVAITKLGTGTLNLNGPASGVPSQWGQLFVNEGKVVLNHSVAQGAGYLNHPGFVVGDGVGGPDADILEVNVALQSQTAPLVKSSGLLSFLVNQPAFAGYLELTGGHVNVANGVTVSTWGPIATGGTITLGTGATYINSFAGVKQNVASQKLTIEGAGAIIPNPTYFWDVAHGTDPSGIDLDVSAVIGGANGLRFKSNAGTGSSAVTRLSGANTYTGTTGLGTGIFWLHGNSANDGTTPGVLGKDTGDVIIGQNDYGNSVTILTDGPYTIARNFAYNSTLALGNDSTIGGRTVDASAFTGNFNLANNTRTLSLTAAAGGTVTFSGNITDGGYNRGFTKIGTGTVILSGANTYTGNTIVNAGTLLVNGTHSGSGGFTVASGATIGGNGTLAATLTLTNGAAIAPGTTSPGVLTLGGLNLTNTATYVYEAADLVDVNGALNLDNNGSITGGTWTLQLLQGGRGLGNGGSLTLFTYNTLTGTPNLNPTFVLTGFAFSPTLQVLNDGNGTIYLNGLYVIPEPSTMLLFGLGGFVLWRSRRQRQ